MPVSENQEGLCLGSPCENSDTEAQELCVHRLAGKSGSNTMLQYRFPLILRQFNILEKICREFCFFVFLEFVFVFNNAP